MSLKTYIDNQIQAFRQKSSQGLLVGLQGSPTNNILPIFGAHIGESSSDIIEINLVKISDVGTYDSSAQLYNFKELEKISIDSNKMKFDIGSNQYVIDNSIDIELELDKCIYFLEFTNGFDTYKTDAFYANPIYNSGIKGINYDKIEFTMEVY